MELITDKTRQQLERGLKEEVKGMTSSEREAYLEETANYFLLLDDSFNGQDYFQQVRVWKNSIQLLKKMRREYQKIYGEWVFSQK
ncbi:MAG TPA: hypothetical protein VMC80_03650 [Patescibacteria group bacterium]|nr:hypothetical protein [Patescibacteria group bacterium]